MSPAEFCREIEAYLCRKNEGHLIRIVGPAFGTVTGWAAQGVPLKVAFKGIDRYFDRQQQKAHGQRALQTRRRPVQIQFCEADILDAFDEWRRALGVSASVARAAGADSADGADITDSAAEAVVSETAAVAPDFTAASAKRKAGLQTHIDRAMARLTQRRVEAGLASGFAKAIDGLLAQLDVLRAEAKGARHDTRDRIVAALASLDRALLDAASAALEAPVLAALRADALRELEPFRSRMPPDAFARAADAATDRLVRDRARLPIIRVDE